MKKLAILICIAVMMCALSAFAENSPTQMRVTNCEDWVSLREDPDIHSARLTKVPLGETVDVYSFEDEFAYCSYKGIFGYVMIDYLEVAETAAGFDDYWNSFTVDNGIVFFNMMNESVGYDLLKNVRSEEGEIDGTYSAVADISGVVNGRIEIWEGGYFIISSDFQDRVNPLIRELYSEAASYFVTKDSGLAADMYDDLSDEFEKEYLRNTGTDRLIIDRYDRIGRYVGVFDTDSGLKYWAFMGELQ